MKNGLLSFLMVFVISSAIVQADDWSKHQNHAGFYKFDNWVGPLTSTQSVQRHVLKFSHDEWNKVATPQPVSVTKTHKSTHSWDVTGNAEAGIKTGVLARAISEGHVLVSIGGTLSGSDEYEWQIKSSQTIPACYGYGYRWYLDDFYGTAYQETATRYWECPECGTGPVKDEVKSASGTGDGDDNSTGEWIPLGAYSQSTDACKPCYKAP